MSPTPCPKPPRLSCPRGPPDPHLKHASGGGGDDDDDDVSDDGDDGDEHCPPGTEFASWYRVHQHVIGCRQVSIADPNAGTRVIMMMVMMMTVVTMTATMNVMMIVTVIMA